MRQIISDIIEMLRGTTDLIQFEEDFVCVILKVNQDIT
jgi:hypothetical protein